MSYSRIQYNDYKSEKLTTQSEINQEKNKALDNGIDLISITNFERQNNGLFSGRKTTYHFKNNNWKLI